MNRCGCNASSSFKITLFVCWKKDFRFSKKFALSESRIAFCRLYIVRVKKVFYERKVGGVFFSLCTAAALPICFYYKLQASGVRELGRVSVLQ